MANHSDKKIKNLVKRIKTEVIEWDCLAINSPRDKNTIIDGQVFVTTIDYLQCYFEETVKMIKRQWRRKAKHEKRCKTQIHNEYNVNSMIREWEYLMEVWKQRQEINQDDFLALHDEIGYLFRDLAK